MSNRKVDTKELMRDELYSHIQRCGVLDASAPEQEEWLADTMLYLRERYPDLTDLEVAHVQSMAQRYLAPPIPRGADFHNMNRSSWEDSEVEENEAALATVG